jgi:lipoprotein-anchoring transpeptidase ErfK/SrfK
VNKRLLLVVGVIIVLLVLVIILSVKIANQPLKGIADKTGSASALLAEAKRLEAQQDLPQAKAAYQKLISEFPNAREVLEWQKKTEEMNIKLLFSPTITPKSIEYEIKAGDSLEKIAKDHKTTVELIMKRNNLKDDKIFPGQKINVWIAPFSIVVDKSQNTLILKSDEEVIKTYIVSTGANNSTPVGTFKIIEKIVDPPWYKTGAVIPPGSPENILGSRWMGLDKEGYGIHGTRDPQSLGKQVTAGCVRLSNQEVEELYSIVAQATEVTIVN